MVFRRLNYFRETVPARVHSCRFCLIYLVVVVGSLFAATIPVLGQETEGLQDALRILDAWTANRVLSQGLPGLSIGVVVGDHLVWARGYGYADLEKKIPATPQTLYGIRSMTKTFTAVAILQLRDAGKLQLDDALAVHLSQIHIQKHSSRTPDITIRELLTHTSGLQRDPPGTIWTDGTYSTQTDLTRPLLQIYEPDMRWYYSNLGFALLGQVVAAEAHQPWQTYIQEHILTPLRMTKTRPVPRRDEPGLAVAYVRTSPGGPLVPADPIILWPGAPTAIDGAGAIASNVEDLAKYAAFHLAEGSNGDSPVLSGRTLREMHRPHWLLPDWQESWGLGVRVRRANGYVRIGHAGGGGYAAEMYFIPALKLGVIVLTNSEDDDPGIYRDYAIQLLAPILDNSYPRATSKLPLDYRRFIGLYEAKNHLGRMMVALLDGNLMLLAPDEQGPRKGGTLLQPAGEPNAFFQREPDVGPSESPGEKLTFDVSADGAVTGFHTDNFRYSRIGPLPSQ
jgi:CubicO group peptidase (beta-lactamase class C family)